MKAFLLALATLALVGHTALAANSTARIASNADANCLPGMTAPVRDLFVTGYHWVLTTHYSAIAHGLIGCCCQTDKVADAPCFGRRGRGVIPLGGNRIKI